MVNILSTLPNLSLITLSTVLRLISTLRHDRVLLWAIILVFIARIFVFFGTMYWPIPNENQFYVSPLHPPGYQDFEFYMVSLERYAMGSLWEIIGDFVAFYQRPFEDQFGHIIAGPVFPALVALFDYQIDKSIPFSIFFFLLSSMTACLWLIWMAKHQISKIWLLLFAVAPNPIWFMLVLSPDAIFAMLVCAFFLSYFREKWSTVDILVWVSAAILASLTRPNGYSLLLFVLIDMSIRHLMYGRHHLYATFGTVIVFVIFSLYLYPYFITEIRKSLGDTAYFGVQSREYLQGLFAVIPDWIDIVASWLTLLGAKILYFVGIRPSYGSTEFEVVLIRAASGLILLPGLIYAGFAMPGRQRLFMVLFCLPIFMGPTQDRYNLPVYPILFMYGGLALNALYQFGVRHGKSAWVRVQR